MAERLGDGPIEPKLHSLMNDLAVRLDQLLNGPAKGKNRKNRKNGFVLLVFPFEGNEGRCNYISNADRRDIVIMMKEQIKRFEGQPEISGRA